MKNLLIVFSLFILFCTSCAAKSIKSDITSVINNSRISGNSVSVSVKDLNSGKTVYTLNDKILMHPASVQKMLTLPSAISILGEDYEFSTEIYSRDNKDYLIKLSGDPFLSFSDLKTLTDEINKDNYNSTVFIDDSVIENKDWGEGWQWDDDLNIYMPRFNAYNIDKNIIKITIMKDNKDENTIIINPSKYPMKFINNTKTGEKSNIKVSRDNQTLDSLTLEGTVNDPVTIYVPVNNLKKYFNFKLRQGLEDRNVYLKKAYVVSKYKISDKKLAEIKHPISDIADDILKNSNNMASETVQKVSASKAYGKTGTDSDGIKVFYSYCEGLGINTSGIRIVDSSGVSKNNLVSTDFISDFLIKNKNNKTLEKLPTAGEGTLSDRMIPLKGSIKAKTGTLSDISSIAGYLTSKNGKKYVFAIIINDPASSESDKKTLEDYIIRELWLRG